ncbi:MAG: nuclear transport factor 2 family protein [Cyanobacteriota bacterium]|nr:nuclear transport factor 2 family protein [Cyanobacteriota bacterium]
MSTLIASLLIFSGLMNSENIHAMVQRQAKAWETGDVSAIVRDFAPNATFVAGDYTFHGVEAIQKAAEDYFRQFTNTQIMIKRIIVDGVQGAVEWEWSDIKNDTGELSKAEDAIIFEVQKDSQIIYWREYIEKKGES